MVLAGFDRRDLGMMVSLTRMSLTDRYLGSALGLAWAVLSPLAMLGIFCFVFTYVFPGRLPGREGTLPFLIWLISGYGPWLSISEGLGTATGSVVGNAGIVKNIAFKSELLPIVSAITGLVPLVVAFGLIVVLQAFGGIWPSPALIALPIAIILQIVFVSGLGLFLGALNVFVRDTALILPNVLTIILFASPIFYPLSAYPKGAQAVLVYNPFYVLAECYRQPILEGALPHLWTLGYMTVISVAVFLGGLWWFRRLKSFFDTRL
ncbi:ABC transporter permease [Microvirga alba]|uniref:Transport permease protein n=1 Tax=Microvirga alba TaxID=2791025 RepID=A0A931BQQ3_9HYPH|nr:ABC transporter permease [Microvirga alba]MBF9231985.1 ABC transporter permease [Microvirga alba]